MMKFKFFLGVICLFLSCKTQQTRRYCNGSVHCTVPSYEPSVYTETDYYDLYKLKKRVTYLNRRRDTLPLKIENFDENGGSEVYYLDYKCNNKIICSSDSSKIQGYLIYNEWKIDVSGSKKDGCTFALNQKIICQFPADELEMRLYLLSQGAYLRLLRDSFVTN